MSDKPVPKRHGRWTFAQLEEAIHKLLPDARLWEDHDGELCVATRLEFPCQRWNASKDAHCDWQNSELHPFSGD